MTAKAIITNIFQKCVLTVGSTSNGDFYFQPIQETHFHNHYPCNHFRNGAVFCSAFIAIIFAILWLYGHIKYKR